MLIIVIMSTALVVALPICVLMYIAISKTYKLARIIQDKQAALDTAYAVLQDLSAEHPEFKLETYVERCKLRYETVSRNSYSRTSSTPSYWLNKESNNSKSSSVYNNKIVIGTYKK